MDPDFFADPDFKNPDPDFKNSDPICLTFAFNIFNNLMGSK